MSEIFRNFAKHLQAISFESAYFQRILFRKCLSVNSVSSPSFLIFPNATTLFFARPLLHLTATGLGEGGEIEIPSARNCCLIEKLMMKITTKSQIAFSSSWNKSHIELQKVHCYSVRPNIAKPRVSGSSICLSKLGILHF